MTAGVDFHHVGWQRRFAVLVLLASVAALASAFVIAQALAILAVISGVFGTVWASILLATAARDPGAHAGYPATLSRQGDCLTIQPERGRARTIALDRIEGGWYEEYSDAAVAVLRLHSGTLMSARCATVEQASELLALVGADAKATAIQVARANAGTRGCAAGCLYGTALFGLPMLAIFVGGLVTAITGESEAVVGVTISGMFTTLAAVVVWHAARLVPTATLTIGSDGVRVKRSFWPMRFIPFEDLDAACCNGPDLVLATRQRRFCIGCQNFAAADAIAGRIERMRGLRLRDARGLDLSILERGDRSPEDWCTHVASLAERGANYREQAFARSDLLAVVENPNIAPERRVGAALAVAARAADNERQRLRIAAEACAHPRLRLALARAAQGEVELAALDEAMRAHR